LVLWVWIIGFFVGYRAADTCPAPIEAPAAVDKIQQTAPAEPFVVATVEQITYIEETPTYTDAELETLALIIYQEAGGNACSDETRMMVGTVVLNRVADSRFPDTIQDVALQRAQYGRLYWTGLKWPDRASREVEAHAVARAYDCAERLLDGDRALPADVVFQAEFTQGTEVVAHQDGIYFCR
jgi:hypothetical protein